METACCFLEREEWEEFVGLFILAGFSLIYFTVHNSLYKWLHTDMYQSVQPSAPAVIFVICLLLFGSAISTLVTRNQSSTIFAVMYLWFVSSR